MAHETFGTAINCIDGRAQKPVSDWIKKHGGADFVDTVTIAGVDKFLSESDEAALESLKRQVMISVTAHGSGLVAVAGHHDCAGNPVSDEEHAADIRKAVEAVRGWEGAPSRVVGLMVNKDWGVDVVVPAGDC